MGSEPSFLGRVGDATERRTELAPGEAPEGSSEFEKLKYELLNPRV